jgi:hypothetical protein
MKLPAWVKSGETVYYNDFSAPLLNGVVQSGAINFTEIDKVNSASGLTVSITETDITSVTDVFNFTVVQGQRASVDPTPQFWVDPSHATQSIVGPNGEQFSFVGYKTVTVGNAPVLAGFLKYQSSSATYDVVFDASTGLILQYDEIFATEEVFRNIAAISSQPTPSQSPSPSADFNGDGKSDVLWRNTTGDVVVWNSNSNAETFTGQDFGASTSSWQILGTGDFNADGKSDVLWRNTNGDVVIWNSNSGSETFTSQDFGVSTSSWQVQGVGDFNADGKADVLWRNTNGDVVIWNSNSGSETFTGQDFGVSASSWQIQGVGDFNGDGKADIFWRNTNGDVVVWNSNSGSETFTGQDFGVSVSSWNTFAGNDTLVSSPANNILYGNPGNTTFVVGPGAGNDTIENFQTTQDTLQFSPSLFANFAAAMTHATQAGANTVFAIDANDSVTLQNVTLTNLTATNFNFA